MERENEEGALDAEAQGTRRQPTRALCHCSRCIYKRARKERRKEEAVNGGGASLFVLFEKGERTPGPPAPPRPPPALSHGGDSSSSSGSATAEVTVQSSTGRDRTTNTAGRAEGPGRPRPCPSFLCPSCRPCARCSPPAPSQQAGGRRFPAAAFPSPSTCFSFGAEWAESVPLMIARCQGVSEMAARMLSRKDRPPPLLVLPRRDIAQRGEGEGRREVGKQ